MGLNCNIWSQDPKFRRCLSICSHYTVAEHKIANEIKLGRVAGHFVNSFIIPRTCLKGLGHDWSSRFTILIFQF